MATQLTASLFSGPKEVHFRSYKCFFRVSASLDIGVRGVPSTKIASTPFEQTKERISTLIHEAELSVSTYDTAWVAMVPSPHSLQRSCFPECLEWLLENQCSDGSWSRPHHHPLLQKDVLSSTLACVLALKKWGIGEEQINRGQRFIELNFAFAMETRQISPIGFDIVFPAMIEYARDMLLNLKLDPTISNDLILKRDMELKRWRKSHSVEREAYLAYVTEGMGLVQNWELVMKYQRKNGSLFNSPSATAAAFSGFPNTECLNYLRTALKKFVNTVPAVYPLAIYSKLCALDNLQRLGIRRHFMKEIRTVLDETYRFWLQGNEEIFMDASTCALAFRLLRANGYKVTSDQITKILQEYLSSSFCGHMKDIHTTLGFYRASEFVLSPDERDLEVQNLQLKCVLEQELSTGFTHSNLLGRCIGQEVNDVVEYPFYASMDRIDKRRNIEHYVSNNTRMSKSSFCSPSFCNKDFLLLSVEDFNRCQAIHQKELRELERWVMENRLNELKFARSKAAYCYFSAAATIFDPELSDARLSWAKNGVLTTVVDDFFDVGGSIEELEMLIQLVKGWDVEISTAFTSNNVQIIFSALKSTICELGDKGFIRQGRNVTNHIIEIWLDLMNSMMKEAKWSGNNSLPTLNEYMNNAYVSFALGPIVLPTLYLVGPTLSEEMVQNSEYHNLFKLMSTCGRLLNDIRTCEREVKDGTLNAIPLYVHNSSGKVTKEAAIAEMRSLIDSTRKELLRLVLERENSTIPKPCKDLFWHMSTVVHLFYSKDDGFTSQDMFRVVNTIIHEPIHLDELHGQPGQG